MQCLNWGNGEGCDGIPIILMFFLKGTMILCFYVEFYLCKEYYFVFKFHSPLFFIFSIQVMIIYV